MTYSFHLTHIEAFAKSPVVGDNHPIVQFEEARTSNHSLVNKPPVLVRELPPAVLGITFSLDGLIQERLRIH